MMNTKSLFFEIETRLCSENYSLMNKKSAEPKSLYSDPELDRNFEWRLVIPKSYLNDPKKLISLLVVISREKPFWYSSFIEQIATLAKRYNYQGKWRLLHKLAKLYHYDLIRYRIQEELTGNEFFGNYYPYIKKYLQNPQIEFRRITKPKPKFIQRGRGYKDKGSTTPVHKQIKDQTVSGPNPKKQDFTTQYKRKNSLLNFLYG